MGVTVHADGAVVGPGPLLARIVDELYCGLVLVPDHERAGEPHWVFTLGDPWSIRMFKTLDGDPLDSVQAPVPTGLDVMVAALSEEYMPTHLRRALGMYLREVVRLPEPASRS